VDTELLKDDFRVLLQIYDTTVVKKGWMTYYELWWTLDGRINEHKINKALDRLSDMGILDSKYEKIGNKWASIFFITDEGMKFTEDMYNKCIVSDCNV
jgi:DNA-binding PadR family transcriptional regulator